jgi:hypothetical protein
MQTTVGELTVGKVIQIAGPAIDIQFPEGHIPAILTAIRVTSEGFNVPTPGSLRWRSTSGKAVFVLSRCSPPKVWFEE